MSDDSTLTISLGQTEIGQLRDEGNGKTSFRFSDNYIEGAFRPVLGQNFLDDLRAPYEGKHFALPTFFSNLLPDPDGYLRSVIARQIGVPKHHEFALLAALGEDLPGAVLARGPRSNVDPGDHEPVPERARDQLTFSLAGVQLKVSMVREGQRYIYPPQGVGGDYVVKLPDSEIDALPENEYAMMEWARESGIDVPQIDLVEPRRLLQLPTWLNASTRNAYAVRRFDRPSLSERLHIEDMCQVFGLAPDKKYEQRHYHDIGALLRQLPDTNGFDQLIRRLVFMLASGDTDSHLKNWSLIYLDGVRAQLAPAYDLVSAQVYERFRADRFALKLARSKEYRDADMAAFRHLARLAGASPTDVERITKEAIERTLDQWARLKNGLPISDEFKNAIEHHWKSVPLLNGR